MIIALTGYMGCGKSSVGAIVADALGCPFTDLDSAVEKAAGRTVADIFATDGEATFRTLEEKTLRKILGRNATMVLALGGGTVTIPGVPALLKEKTLCIWLQAPVDVLWSRVSTSGRPLADDSFAARLTAREPLYAAASHVTIDTTGLSPEEIAEEIIISCL